MLPRLDVELTPEDDVVVLAFSNSFSQDDAAGEVLLLRRSSIPEPLPLLNPKVPRSSNGLSRYLQVHHFRWIYDGVRHYSIFQYHLASDILQYITISLSLWQLHLNFDLTWEDQRWIWWWFQSHPQCHHLWSCCCCYCWGYYCCCWMTWVSPVLWSSSHQTYCVMHHCWKNRIGDCQDQEDG